MSNLEDKLADEIELQGCRASPDIFRQMLTEAIGRLDTQGLVCLTAGSITLPDFVRSYRQSHPDAFASSNDGEKSSGNLTADMRREIAKTRSRSLPADWATVRSRYAGKNNLTGAMMDERAAARQR